ncbi:MAG: D-amino acid dehydrogenase [Pseudomonadota bacterium]
MRTVAVIGAGITGVTTAYALSKRGFDVTIIDRQPQAAMETSFANGGQLSASNAAVWNRLSTVLKGLKWLTRKDAPLLMNPRPGWHKYSWLAEFLSAIPHYERNTIETVRLAIAARGHLLDWAKDEGIDFDLERRGILHVYEDKAEMDAGRAVSRLLAKGGLARNEVGPSDIASIDPTLPSHYVGGFFTPSDFTGDVHKFTNGLAKACAQRGVKLWFNEAVEALAPCARGGVDVARAGGDISHFDAVVVCAGVGSRAIGRALGDRVNVYPVKGYSISVMLDDAQSREAAPHVSLLDEAAKIVTSRLGNRFRVAGTAEFNGENRAIRQDRVAPLENWVRHNFPGVSMDHVVPWAGLRPMMPNMMPRVGAGNAAGVFYNTGHGHLGWTLSAATAEMIADTVLASAALSVRPVAKPKLNASAAA